MKDRMTPTTAFGFSAFWLALAIWALVSAGNGIYILGSLGLSIAFVVFGLMSRRRIRGARE